MQTRQNSFWIGCGLRWFTVLTALLLATAGLSVRAEDNDMPSPVHSDIQLYIINIDFPPDPLVSHPTPSAMETRFWQELNQAMEAQSGYHLTESLERADYRVKIACTGVLNCSRLQVAIQKPNRDTLVTYQLPIRKYPWEKINLSQVSQHLASTLKERIEGLQSGGTGDYGAQPAEKPAVQTQAE
jgi:hypothetical protein